jgi:hypothetical protein
MHVPLIGIAFFIRATLSITVGISGFLIACMKKAWHIGKILRLIGAQIVKLFWPTSKLLPDYAKGVITL